VRRKTYVENVEKRRSRVRRRGANSDRETVLNFERRNASRSVGLGRSLAESAVRLSSRLRNGRWEAVESRRILICRSCRRTGIRLSQIRSGDFRDIWYFGEIFFTALKQLRHQFFQRRGQELVRETQVVDLEGNKLFGVERYDLDVLVIYFVILAVFFDIFLLEILYYEVRIVIFQIVEDYGKEKLVAAAMCPGKFQLEITIVATRKEELTGEVTMVTDLPISVSEGSFTVVADGGVGVL